jgi:hypothetical protein
MSLLDIIILFLIISWFGGYSLHLGGNLIHLLLVLAVGAFVVRLLGISI